MPRAPLSEDDIEFQRQRFCAAAMVLYRTKGYEAVTLRNLAQRLKLSHTLAYRYFDSKDALFARIRTDCVRNLLETIRSHDPIGERPVARIHAMALALLDFVRAHPDQYRLIFDIDQPPLHRHLPLLKARRELFDYIVDVIQEGVDSGEIHGDARTVMHCAWAAAHGALMLHAANQLIHGRTLDDLVQPLLETIIGPLLRGQPASRSKHKPSATARRAAPKRQAKAAAQPVRRRGKGKKE